MVLLMYWFIKAPRVAVVKAPVVAGQTSSLGDVVRERNVTHCALIGILLVSYLVVRWASAWVSVKLSAV
jgi:hypothetical protein